MEKNLLKKITKLFIFSIAGGFLVSIIFMFYGFAIDGINLYIIAAYAPGSVIFFILAMLIGLCIGAVSIIIDIFFKNKKIK